MTDRIRLENARASVEDFTLTPPEDGADFCEGAERFFGWAEELCAAVEERESVVAVNQALVLLVKRFFSWGDNLPRRHRSRNGRQKHVCVFEVFEVAYRRLRELELTISPPPLRVRSTISSIFGLVVQPILTRSGSGMPAMVE